ncbi:hypothetical protein Taro_011189, partial [Colocasia esculenta]|nr:hypothetical protein [Colocasia esculenta]
LGRVSCGICGRAKEEKEVLLFSLIPRRYGDKSGGGASVVLGALVTEPVVGEDVAPPDPAAATSSGGELGSWSVPNATRLGVLEEAEHNPVAIGGMGAVETSSLEVAVGDASLVAVSGDLGEGNTSFSGVEDATRNSPQPSTSKEPFNRRPYEFPDHGVSWPNNPLGAPMLGIEGTLDGLSF